MWPRSLWFGREGKSGPSRRFRVVAIHNEAVRQEEGQVQDGVPVLPRT